MVTSQQKTSTQSFAGYGKGLILFLAVLVFGVGSGFGQTAAITASDASANEAGSDLGGFTISITGGFPLPSVEVFLSIDPLSTATSGSDFQSIPNSVNVNLNVLGNGSSTIDIIPIDDAFAEGEETVILNIVPNASYTIDINNSSATVTILDDEPCNAGNSAPVLDASEPTVFCDEVVADLNDYVTNSAPAGTVLTWSTDPDPLQTDQHRSSLVNNAASYFGFFYDETNNCASPVLTVTLELFPTPIITNTDGDERCGSGTLTLTATTSNGTLSWYDVPTGGMSMWTGGTFVTPSISETTSYYVEATANGCTTERVEVIATVNDTPSAGTPTDTFACNVISNEGPNIIDLDDTLADEDPGTWAVITDPSGGALIIASGNIVDFEGLPTGDYTFEYTTTGALAPCTNTSEQVTISVGECFENAEIDLSITKEVDDDQPLLDSNVVFTITLENTTMDRIVDIIVDDLLDYNAFEYVGHEASLGEYDEITGEWFIPEMTTTDETATLRITVKVIKAGLFVNTATLATSFPIDVQGDNDTDTVAVRVNRSQCEDPGTICNIFSPNGDGKNDRLILVGHEQYSNNRFEVFDRYGNSVFQMDGYNSTWDGTGKNGDLPKGTYFYILDLNGDGTEVVKGWIQIVRKN